MMTMLKDYDVAIKKEDMVERNESNNDTLYEDVSSETVLEVGKMFCDKYSGVFKALAE